MKLDILIYTKAACPNCDAAKRLLQSKNLPFEVRPLEEPGWAEIYFHTYPDIRQMPQIFIDGQCVGGIDGLRAALKQLNL